MSSTVLNKVGFKTLTLWLQHLVLFTTDLSTVDLRCNGLLH